VDDDADFIAALRFDYPFLAFSQRQDYALRGFGLIAEKFAGPDFFSEGEPACLGRRLAGTDPGSPRALPRLVHFAVEAGDLDPQTVAAQDVLRQIKRKAVGIVQRESNASRQG